MAAAPLPHLQLDFGWAADSLEGQLENQGIHYPDGQWGHRQFTAIQTLYVSGVIIKSEMPRITARFTKKLCQAIAQREARFDA